MKTKLPKKPRGLFIRLHNFYPVPPDGASKSFAFYAAFLRSVYYSPDYAFRDTLPSNFSSVFIAHFLATRHPFYQIQLASFPTLGELANFMDFPVTLTVHFGLLCAYGCRWTEGPRWIQIPCVNISAIMKLISELRIISHCITSQWLHMSALNFCFLYLFYQYRRTPWPCAMHNLGTVEGKIFYNN